MAASRPGFNFVDDCYNYTLLGFGIAGLSAVQIYCDNASVLLLLAALGARPVMGIGKPSQFLAQAIELSSKA